MTDYLSGYISIIDIKNRGKILGRIKFAADQKFFSTINLPIQNLVSQPIVDKEEGLYFATHAGVLEKYSLKTQKLIWTIDIPGISNISYVGNTIFVTTIAKQVIAVNALDGQIAWITDIRTDPKKVPVFLPIMVINNSVVALSNTGHITVINPENGMIISHLEIGRPIVSAVVLNQALHVFTEHGVMIFE